MVSSVMFYALAIALILIWVWLWFYALKSPYVYKVEKHYIGIYLFGKIKLIKIYHKDIRDIKVEATALVADNLFRLYLCNGVKVKEFVVITKKKPLCYAELGISPHDSQEFVKDVKERINQIHDGS